MESDGGPAMAEAPPIIVPELRDYQQINAELVRRLNLGQRRIRLEGVDGHRLLVSRIKGSWHAVVEVDGRAGPELAAELNGPGLIVICRGEAADGAGRGLVAGKLVLLEQAGTALGYFQEGGLIVARGDVGPRAGLNQKGGDLVALGRTGPLAGERQSGGRLFLKSVLAGPPGRAPAAADGSTCRLISNPPAGLHPDDRLLLEEAIELSQRFGSPT